MTSDRPTPGAATIVSADIDGIALRRATVVDVPAIVALLADDELGARRESPHDLAPYLAAFAVIDADPHQLLIVAQRGVDVVATLQLSYLPGLSRRGATRSQIEGVRVASSERGNALGTHLMRWCIAQSRQWNCQVVQLTSDKTRTDAHRFYERCGFTATHEGFKLDLS